MKGGFETTSETVEPYPSPVAELQDERGHERRQCQMQSILQRVWTGQIAERPVLKKSVTEVDYEILVYDRLELMMLGL